MVGKNNLMQDTDAEVLLAQHSSQLQALTDGHQQMRNTLDRISEDVHKLSSSLTVLNSRPSFSAGDLLDNILKFGALAGLAVTGILYVNQAFVSVDLEKMRASEQRLGERQDSIAKRIDRLENVLIFKGTGAIPPATTP